MRTASSADPCSWATAIFFYVVACSDRWHVAPGFGKRFLIPLSPVWIVGLATALDAARSWLTRRVAGEPAAWATLAAGLTLAAAWNAGLVFQWGTGLIARRETVDFRQVVLQQFTRVPGRIVQLVERQLGGSGAASSGREPSVSDDARR